MLASSFIVFIAGAAVGIAQPEYPGEHHADQRYGDHHAYGDRHRGQPMLTLYVTSVNLHTTMVTITSCSGGVCTKMPMVTGLTTITENQTVVTTYCPITNEEPGRGHHGRHHGQGEPELPGGGSGPGGPGGPGQGGPGGPGGQGGPDSPGSGGVLPGEPTGPGGEAPGGGPLGPGGPTGDDTSSGLPIVNPENGAVSGAVPVIVLAVAGMAALIL